tara:strand:+ start:416 stop:598 length:183 start_codon:yes stop_codon:yes gene_type:complete
VLGAAFNSIDETIVKKGIKNKNESKNVKNNRNMLKNLNKILNLTEYVHYITLCQAKNNQS